MLRYTVFCLTLCNVQMWGMMRNSHHWTMLWSVLMIVKVVWMLPSTWWAVAVHVVMRTKPGYSVQHVPLASWVSWRNWLSNTKLTPTVSISMYLVEKANCDISEYNTTTMQCYTFVSTPTLAQVQLTMMALLFLTLLQWRVTLKLLTTSSLYHNNVSSLGSWVHSVVQYSYSLYTDAVTGDTDSRSDENGPPPTKKRKSNYYLMCTYILIHLSSPSLTPTPHQHLHTHTSSHTQTHTPSKWLWECVLTVRRGVTSAARNVPNVSTSSLLPVRAGPNPTRILWKTLQTYCRYYRKRSLHSTKSILGICGE